LAADPRPELAPSGRMHAGNPTRLCQKIKQWKRRKQKTFPTESHAPNAFMRSFEIPRICVESNGDKKKQKTTRESSISIRLLSLDGTDM
jgi:hypothetical protein